MIKSGISEVDGHLGGGLGAGIILDVFGPAGSGKTQLAMQFCARAAALGLRVLYNDTRGQFRPERVLDMLPDGAGSRALDLISVLSSASAAGQAGAVSQISPAYSLVIVDGATDLFSFEYGREEQALEKNKSFMQYMRSLAGAAIGSGVPVLVTNMVRNAGDIQAENMGPAISPFTHAKIRMSAGSAKRRGEISSVLGKSAFAYEIGAGGIRAA